MTTSNHAAPWTFRQFMADLFPTRRTPRPTPLMTGREAAARHLYGTTVRWDGDAMATYDASPLLRGGWLAEADRRIAATPLPLSELLILRWWGYTPEQWAALPALVQVDKREGYAQAKGLAA